MSLRVYWWTNERPKFSFFDRKPAVEKPWTANLWIYDLRTNKHFALKENPLKRTDLDYFVTYYNAKNRHERKESERLTSFTYEELTKRDNEFDLNQIFQRPLLTVLIAER